MPKKSHIGSTAPKIIVDTFLIQWNLWFFYANTVHIIDNNKPEVSHCKHYLRKGLPNLAPAQTWRTNVSNLTCLYILLNTDNGHSHANIKVHILFLIGDKGTEC